MDENSESYIYKFLYYKNEVLGRSKLGKTGKIVHTHAQ